MSHPEQTQTPPQHPLPAAGQALPPAQHDAGADALGFVNQIEAQLETLRQMFSQTSKRASDLDVRDAEVKRRQEALDAREQELAAAAEQAERTASERSAAIEELAKRIEQQQAEFAEAARVAQERTDQLQQREDRLAEQEKAAEGRVHALEALDAEVRTRHQALETRDRELAARETAAATRAEEAQRNATEHAAAAEAHTAQREADLEAKAAEREKSIESREQALADHENALAQREAAATAKAEEAQRALDLATNQQADSTESTRILHEREEAIRTLAERLKRAEQQAHEQQSELEESRRALAEAESRLADTEANLAAASDPSSVVVIDDPRLADRNVRRKQRLLRMKQLIAGQSRKIVLARAALHKRQEECERILAERSKLADRAIVLRQQERIINSKRAKSGAAMLVAGVLLSASIVGFLSWRIAQRIAPATFEATAALAADTPGRTPTRDELLAWTAAHKEMAGDPLVYDAAAENFSRRGMNSLATAAAVKQRFDKDLYIHSEEPGKLVLQLRGPGIEHTERELETYLSALIGYANAKRDLRGDGAATSIEKQPTSGVEPVESERAMYAAGLGLAGALLVSILGLGAYKVMARSKQQFENQDAAFDAV